MNGPKRTASSVRVAMTAFGRVCIIVKLLLILIVVKCQTAASPNEDICSKGDGRYEQPDSCNTYIECKDGVHEVKQCPDGLLFDKTESTLKDYPCKYANVVKCEIGEAKSDEPLLSTDDVPCPQAYGVYRVAGNKDCRYYRNCVAGRAVNLHCPEGLAFNDLTSNCEYPEQVPGCHVKALQDTVVPVDDVCSKGDGRYRQADSCNIYIECKNDVREVKECPDGLQFDTEVSMLEDYPCKYANIVKCQNGTADSKAPLASTDDTRCPQAYGVYRVADSKDCGHYRNCVAGRAVDLHCPEGLAFNHLTSNCEYPEQVPECDVEDYLGFRCPKSAGNTELGASNQFYKSSEDPQKYFICVEGKPRLSRCKDDFEFDQASTQCVEARILHKASIQSKLQRSGAARNSSPGLARAKSSTL